MTDRLLWAFVLAVALASVVVAVALGYVGGHGL